MFRHLRLLGLCSAWLLLTLPAQALDVVDDRGVAVSLPRPPLRIVSLLPSLTETVCELGRCDRLVGVDRYSNHPATVRALPQVGGGVDPNIEAIARLRPELVLAATSSRGVQRLEALGFKVVALEPRTGTDVPRVMATLGRVLDVPDALQVWRRIDAAVGAAAQALPAAARGTRVYFEVSRGPYAAGTSSFMGQTLARLGVPNVVESRLGPFPKLNPEYVVRANPDLIMISELHAQGLADRPGWAGIRALREGRVCVFTAAENDILVRPGPRMAEAARLMADCIARKGLAAPPAAASKVGS